MQLNLQGTPSETDRVYRTIAQSLNNYSNSSTVGFEPQTYCMAVWQPNYYTKIARPCFYQLFLLFVLSILKLFSIVNSLQLRYIQETI